MLTHESKRQGRLSENAAEYPLPLSELASIADRFGLMLQNDSGQRGRSPSMGEFQ